MTLSAKVAQIMEFLAAGLISQQDGLKLLDDPVRFSLVDNKLLYFAVNSILIILELE